MDFMPTFAKIANADIPANIKIDGHDLSPVLFSDKDVSASNEVFYYYLWTHLQAVRKGPWKLILPRKANPDWLLNMGRLIEEVSKPQLYNLDLDAEEEYDVAGRNPSIVAELMEEAERARSALGDYDRIGVEQRFDGP